MPRSMVNFKAIVTIASELDPFLGNATLPHTFTPPDLAAKPTLELTPDNPIGLEVTARSGITSQSELEAHTPPLHQRDLLDLGLELAVDLTWRGGTESHRITVPILDPDNLLAP